MSVTLVPIIIRWISRRALRWCYREIRYIGRERVPAEGATLMFGNHPNDLPDVLAGFFTTERPLRYVATISAVTLPLARATYQGMGVIPVTRVRDARKMRAKGVDTAAVNRSAFASVQDAFAAGDLVGVFPEGGVHDSSHIGKPRSGVARMALEGIDDASKSDVTLIGFGLQYEAAQTPRSDLIVVLGVPFSLRAWVESQSDSSAVELSVRLHQELMDVARSSSSWSHADARDRLVAAVSANQASASIPILETAASVQGRCGRLVEEGEHRHSGVSDEVHWRTIADDFAGWMRRVGGTPTSARDAVRVLDAAGRKNAQASWPTWTWMGALAIPAVVGLALHAPLMWGVWQFAKRTAKVRTDVIARAIMPGLHLILLGYVVLGGLIALGFRAASVSGWWAVPVVMLFPRLGDLGLAWRDGARALRLRARVRRLSEAERATVLAAAERVRSAWLTVTTLPSPSS
ncbi:MAG: 1-acyl-sn-glycerol-3-phosphate acyltransferase [Gemmatimonadaceae bacterium]|nr:1-acyl-sn-glycerol-3-phosphate acyltransferase [Gemmatimonadaceae bacterium]